MSKDDSTVADAGTSPVTESPEKQPQLPEDVTWLDDPIPFTEADNFKIIQVVYENAALALTQKRYLGAVYSEPVVLIVSQQKNTFYDDQIVKCPEDREVMQIGTYKYQSRNNNWKTVPVILFLMPQY